MLVEAKRVQRGLTKTDTDKLDEYFQGIRDIETRLNKDETWLDVPKAKPPHPYWHTSPNRFLARACLGLGNDCTG